MPFIGLYLTLSRTPTFGISSNSFNVTTKHTNSLKSILKFSSHFFLRLYGFVHKNYLFAYSMSLIHDRNKRTFFVTVDKGQDFCPGDGSTRKQNISRVRLVPPLWKFVTIQRFAFKPSVRLCRCFHAVQ